MAKKSVTESEVKENEDLESESNKEEETPQNPENTPQEEDKPAVKEVDLSAEVEKKLAQKENKYNNLKQKYKELLKSKNDDSANESDNKSGNFVKYGLSALILGGIGFFAFKFLQNTQKTAPNSQQGGNELSKNPLASASNSMNDLVSNRLYGKDNK